MTHLHENGNHVVGFKTTNSQKNYPKFKQIKVFLKVISQRPKKMPELKLPGMENLRLSEPISEKPDVGIVGVPFWMGQVNII